MDEKKTAAELYSAAIMEAATALTTAGFRILDITGMNAYQVRNKKLGTYQPDSVRLELMIVKEPPAS